MLIRTHRLILRSWREEDRAPFAAMSADPVVMKYFLSPYDRTQADAAIERWNAAIARDGYGLWALEFEGGFIGLAGLAAVPFEAPFTPAIEIGWRLARLYWGRGFATEAGQAALKFGFSELNISEIVAYTAIGNVASQRVMRRLGMRRDQDFAHPNIPDGHALRPHILYRKTRC